MTSPTNATLATFDLTDEQRALRDTIREFARAGIALFSTVASSKGTVR
jgi:hypothetical protein